MQAKTPDTTGVADIGTGTSAPTVQQGACRAAGPAALTCTWVRTGDGTLVMQWTGQTTADAHQEMTKAAA